MNVAAISTYIGQFFSGGVDPSTPHLVLILAAIIGGLGVGIGIIWEAARAGHLWTIPTAFVFFGVIIEAAATVILFEFDEGISRYQQSIIKVQRDQIIALESHLEARSLTPEQSASVVHRVVPAIPSNVGPIAFEFSASTDEEIALAIDLADHVFSKMGWDWIDWPTNKIGAFGIDLPVQKKRLGTIPLSGIQVQVSDKRLSELANVIVDALQSVELENVRTDPAANMEFENANDRPTVAIMIGNRPPLRMPKS